MSTPGTFSMQELNTTRLIAALAALFGLHAEVLASSAKSAENRPNVVVILADDLGWSDLGTQGSKYYETPAIDALAAQSRKFQRHYHSQNCQPTRAALWSGQYAPRTGIYTVGSLDRGPAEDRKLNTPKNVTQLPLDRETIGDALKSAGYRTGYFGKWHLGQQGEHHPGRRGWDEAITSMGRHFGFDTQPPTEHAKDAYLAEWLTERACEFIGKPSETPFFLVLAHFAVHSPLEAKAEKIEHFSGKPAAGGHSNPTYAAMIASLDDSVGRVLKKLDEMQAADDTIVIFTSDNGGVGGYGADARNVTDNAPLRNGKGTHYEGGLRVPFFVRWPGVVKPGTTSHEPTAHVDLFPTLIELAGAKRPKQTLDGLSLVPLWKGDESARLSREYLYFHLPGYLEGRGTRWRTTPVSTVIGRHWKMLEYLEDGRRELYRIDSDISEARDVAVANPQVVQELTETLNQWRNAIGAAMPKRKTRPKAARNTLPATRSTANTGA